MHRKNQREHGAAPRRIRPNQEQIHAHVQAELQSSGLSNWKTWEKDLLSLWEEAIDMGLSQELAREKLDETMRGVITYQRMNLAMFERRQKIMDLFDHMSREIKTHVVAAQGELQVPLSPEEQRAHDRQRRKDDDPEEQSKQQRNAGYRERTMRQHRINSAGHTTTGIQQTF